VAHYVVEAPDRSTVTGQRLGAADALGDPHHEALCLLLGEVPNRNLHDLVGRVPQTPRVANGCSPRRHVLRRADLEGSRSTRRIACSMAQGSGSSQPAEVHPDALEFLFDAVGKAPMRQLESQAALDAKAAQVFSAASIVIGLAGLRELRSASSAAIALLIVALGAYAVVAGAMLVQVLAKGFRIVDNVDEVWPWGWNKGADELRYAFLADAADAFRMNAVLLQTKAKTLEVMLVATGLETLLVGAAIVASAL